MGYKIARVILRGFLFFVFRIKTRGTENVIKSGGAILAANHRSNWDPVLLAVSCPRQLKFMAKAELFKFKPFAALIKSFGAFPIQRGKGDIGAVKAALTILKNQDCMLIFPEGKRVIDESIIEAKPGAVMIATRSEVPIIPAYISGKIKWMSKITITFGEPVSYEEYQGEKPDIDTLQKLTNNLMDTIRAL